MPTYDYRCSATGEVYEVRHGINEQLSSWAQLCERLGIDTGTIDPEAPVERLATGGAVVHARSLKNPKAPPCATGGGCPGGSCGF
ncbi:zinc ribbon domain-containing protein [Motiliproteus sp.]|uniref:zinc ribbon domain-containing protein n=1 Tax=Motiliproteus sp. TaxID=1898955 RepID=UPI003BAD01C3